MPPFRKFIYINLTLLIFFIFLPPYIVNNYAVGDAYGRGFLVWLNAGALYLVYADIRAIRSFKKIKKLVPALLMLPPLGFLGYGLLFLIWLFFGTISFL